MENWCMYSVHRFRFSASRMDGMLVNSVLCIFRDIARRFPGYMLFCRIVPPGLMFTGEHKVEGECPEFARAPE